MQQTVENFLRALRAMNVRVSPAEAIDAHIAIDLVGFSDRTFLKDTLCVALAKSEEEVHAFDECFDMFFTREEFQDRREGEDSEEDDEAAGFDPELIGEQALAQLLLDGSASEMAQAMERAANEANVANIRFGTQRGLFTRRVLD
ncbi:MAG: VWA containing CoxE family protein, partial [Alphaproteobacteria bacterium]